MAHIVMAYIVDAYMVMAYIVMALYNYVARPVPLVHLDAVADVPDRLPGRVGDPFVKQWGAECQAV